jgi:hypothetical protein
MNEKKSLIRYPNKEAGKVDDKFELLMEYMGRLMEEKFTGYIRINFSQGNIGRTEKFEEILRQK